MNRVVLDTNVVVSALLVPSGTRQFCCSRFAATLRCTFPSRYLANTGRSCTARDSGFIHVRFKPFSKTSVRSHTSSARRASSPYHPTNPIIVCWSAPNLPERTIS